MLAILFEMDGRLWGADARLVETVVPAVRLRGVQGAPEWIAGVFNYKGNTVPAIDLSMYVCNRPSERIFSTRYMIVKISSGVTEGLVALIAERVTRVVEICDPDIGPSEGGSYCGGVFTVDGEIAQMLKIEKLIDSDTAAKIIGMFNK